MLRTRTAVYQGFVQYFANFFTSEIFCNFILTGTTSYFDNTISNRSVYSLALSRCNGGHSTKSGCVVTSFHSYPIPILFTDFTIKVGALSFS